MEETSQEKGSPDRGELIELADSLLAEARQLRQDYDELTQRLDAMADPEWRPTDTSAEPDELGVEDGMKLVAMNLALSGGTREEVDRYLQETFNTTETKHLLDDVFGSHPTSERVERTREGGKTGRRRPRFPGRN